MEDFVFARYNYQLHKSAKVHLLGYFSKKRKNRIQFCLKHALESGDPLQSFLDGSVDGDQNFYIIVGSYDFVDLAALRGQDTCQGILLVCNGLYDS